MREKIRIDFSDFSAGFDKKSNFFCDLLSTRYDIEITDRPDFLIYSVFGTDYLNYDCIRILYTGENKRPSFDECDYAFSFDYLDDKRNFRLPLYLIACDVSLLTKPNPAPETLVKSKFCNMVVSNPLGKERTAFFHKLSAYRKVDSGGKYLNNIGGPVADKMQFMKDYKFTLAFENSVYPGYTTEKLVQAMLAHTVAIYWGNPLVNRDFNTKSFINCYDYRNFDEVVARIIEVDNNTELYEEYLRQPYFTDNIPNKFVDKEKILEQFDFIFSNDITPVAQKEARAVEMLTKKITDLVEDLERLNQERPRLSGPELTDLETQIGKARWQLIHSKIELQETIAHWKKKQSCLPPPA
jgi:alpha(1,3/1,4) fucosyltransferase